MRWILALAILLLTGCSTPVDGAAVGVEVTATFAAELVPWDPCAIPDSAVEAAGLNVDSKLTDLGLRPQPGFKICGWDDASPDRWFVLTVFSSGNNLQSLDATTSFDRTSDVRVGSRSATQYHAVNDDSARDCDLAVEIAEGLVQVALFTDPLVASAGSDPCETLIRVATALETHLPNP